MSFDVIEKRTIEEAYTSATNSSNLRCEADRRTDVDVLIAAGCTPGILGAALMRLHSEWDGCAKPRAMTETEARLLMGNIKTLPRVLTFLSDWAALRGLDGGFVVCGQSTSKMTKAEMCELQELMEAFGVEKGVRFRAPEGWQ